MLTSHSPAVPPRRESASRPNRPSRQTAGSPRPPVPVQARRTTPALPGPAPRPGLDGFNTAAPGAAESVLLACCGSRRWAHRLTTHRPYPDLDALLAAADEASYDLTPADLAEALAAESVAPTLPSGAGAAALTALRAAHAAYESRFGHVFVICLDGLRPDESLDHVLGGFRTRLGHDLEEERAVTADELRRIARGRLLCMAEHPGSAPGFQRPQAT